MGKKNLFPRKILRGVSVAVLLLIIIFSWVFFIPVSHFPVGKIIEIPSGTTLSGVSDILKKEGVISSGFLFRVYVKIFAGNRPVLSGSYLLDERQSLVGMADRLISGNFHVSRIKILVTEGMDVQSISEVLASSSPAFQQAKFLETAQKMEGYLFPDTYFFFSTVSPEEVISVMRENFDTKTTTLNAKIRSSGHTLQEIITMASIIEREAVTPKDRRIISGILWKRISLGMPLQVDATFSYINGKGSAELTASDLKIDSPYNTYVYRGLPPGPIANPGFDTILSALEPVKTPYLYYLSDDSGVMHYAKTFSEHVVNKTKYLK